MKKMIGLVLISVLVMGLMPMASEAGNYHPRRRNDYYPYGHNRHSTRDTILRTVVPALVGFGGGYVVGARGKNELRNENESLRYQNSQLQQELEAERSRRDRDAQFQRREEVAPVQQQEESPFYQAPNLAKMDLSHREEVAPSSYYVGFRQDESNARLLVVVNLSPHKMEAKIKGGRSVTLEPGEIDLQWVSKSVRIEAPAVTILRTAFEEKKSEVRKRTVAKEFAVFANSSWMSCQELLKEYPKQLNDHGVIECKSQGSPALGIRLEAARPEEVQ